MMPIACIIHWLVLWVYSCLNCRGRFFLYNSIVLDRSQLGGVVPVMAMVWKSGQMALWNAGGMYSSRTPGMLSWPGAF